MITQKDVYAWVRIARSSDDPYRAIDEEMRSRIEFVAEWSCMSDEERRKFVDVLLKR